MLLVCGGDMDVLTPPTPSDSLCQALDLHQVQRARFPERCAFLWYDQLAFDLSGADQDKETKVTAPDVAMGVSSDSSYASHSLQGHSQSFTLACLLFQLVIPSTAVCQVF